MFQTMTSSFLAVLLASVASAQDITSIIGSGNGQGAQKNGYYNSAPTGSNSQQSHSGYTHFDPTATQPITSPGQAMSSQSQGSDPMGALLGGGAPSGNGGGQPSSNGGGHYYDSAPSGGNSQQMGGGQMATNPMQTLLSGMMGGAQQGNNGNYNGGGGIQSAPLVSHGQVNSQVLSLDSKEVVSGLIEAFMHKYTLDKGEKDCLERNVGQLTGDVMGTVGDIVTAIKALIAGHGSLTQGSQGPLVSAGLDSAMKITGLVSSATSLAKGCVHGDALQMLKDTAHHMINGTYLQHRILVNGVDVAHDLADAVVAFEAHDFHRFGADIGTSLRKILLSNSNKATRLPEGVPEEVIIQQTMDGLVSGFFVSGSAIEITDTAHPDVDIRVDLHQCMAGNEAFFKGIWMALWELIAQLSANGMQMFQPHGQQGQPKWAGELMVAMMQFPMALSRCGISGNMQHMLMEAVKTLEDLKVHFTFPQDRIRGEQATQKMAKAVEAWTNWNFEKFGFELGKLFRELVMLAFPQQYSVDASGRLQRMSAEELRCSFSSPLLIISGASISLFVALAVVRTRRSSSQEVPNHMVPMTDIEDGDALELLE